MSEQDEMGRKLMRSMPIGKPLYSGTIFRCSGVDQNADPDPFGVLMDLVKDGKLKQTGGISVDGKMVRFTRVDP